MRCALRMASLVVVAACANPWVTSPTTATSHPTTSTTESFAADPYRLTLSSRTESVTAEYRALNWADPVNAVVDNTVAPERYPLTVRPGETLTAEVCGPKEWTVTAGHRPVDRLRDQPSSIAAIFDGDCIWRFSAPSAPDVYFLSVSVEPADGDSHAVFDYLLTVERQT